jgi:hypothetical protein
MRLEAGMRALPVLLFMLVGLLASPGLAFERKLKLGTNAVPITRQTAYLRSAPARTLGTQSRSRSVARMERREIRRANSK